MAGLPSACPQVLHPESSEPGDTRKGPRAGLKHSWNAEATSAPRHGSPRSGTPWWSRSVARGQVRGGAGRTGRDEAGGGRRRPRVHRGRAPSPPAPRHGPARPAAPPATRAAAGALRVARPAAGKDPHRHRPQSPQGRGPLASQPYRHQLELGDIRGWRPQLVRRAEGRRLGGCWGLGRLRFAEPGPQDTGSRSAGATLVLGVRLVGSSHL